MRTGLIFSQSSLTPQTYQGSSFTTAQSWVGGVTALAIDATQYGTINLQILNISGNWINITSSFVSNQLYVFNAPPGQYRLCNQSGSSLGVAAYFGPVPYNL